MTSPPTDRLRVVGSGSATRVTPPEPELRSFLHVVYRALMMVAKYLEKTYGF